MKKSPHHHQNSGKSSEKGQIESCKLIIIIIVVECTSVHERLVEGLGQVDSSTEERGVAWQTDIQAKSTDCFNSSACRTMYQEALIEFLVKGFVPRIQS